MTILTADQRNALVNWVVIIVAIEENSDPEIQVVPNGSVYKYFLQAGRRKVIFTITHQGELVVSHDSRKDSGLKSAKAS